MNRWKSVLLVAIVSFVSLVVFPGCCLASSLEDFFKQGNISFEKGEYQKAVDLFRKLEELGVDSPELYYNRATAEARLGNLGKSIQYYEKVLVRVPGDEHTVHNLSTIRDFIARRASEQGRDADLAPAAGPWRALLDRFSLPSATISFLIFYLSLFIVLIVRRYVKEGMIRMTMGVLVGVLAAISIFTGTVLVGKWSHLQNVREAVVISNELLPVREGPASDVVRFELEEGSRLRVLEKRDSWFLIQDDQGRNGWSEAQSLGEI